MATVLRNVLKSIN